MIYRTARTVLAQALVAFFALMQGSTVAILWTSFDYLRSYEPVLYLSLGFQWVGASLLIYKNSSRISIIVCTICFISTSLPRYGIPEFWPLWFASLFLPLAGSVVVATPESGLLRGVRLRYALGLGLSVTMYSVLVLHVNKPWALAVACILILVDYRNVRHFRVFLLASALALDVFTGRVWRLYGVDDNRFYDQLLAAQLDSWETLLNGLLWMAIVTLTTKLHIVTVTGSVNATQRPRPG